MDKKIDDEIICIKLKNGSSFIDTPAWSCYLFSKRKGKFSKINDLLVYCPASEITFQINKHPDVFVSNLRTRHNNMICHLTF